MKRMQGPIKTPRTFELISERILEGVASGEWRVGDRLPNERDLAKSFEVSRHAVRESLRSLESMGLVQLRKGAAGGAFVTNSGPGAAAEIMRGMLMVGGVSLEQLTEARLGIETAVVRAACAHADDAAIAAMAENVHHAEAATKAGNLAEKTRLNIEFHGLLSAATRNPVYTMVMASILGVLEQFATSIGSVMDLDVIASRRRLLRHLSARDADKAAAEMERHLRALHRHYIDAATARAVGSGGGHTNPGKPAKAVTPSPATMAAIAPSTRFHQET